MIGWYAEEFAVEEGGEFLLVLYSKVVMHH